MSELFTHELDEDPRALTKTTQRRRRPPPPHRLKLDSLLCARTKTTTTISGPSEIRDNGIQDNGVPWEENQGCSCHCPRYVPAFFYPSPMQSVFHGYRRLKFKLHRATSMKQLMLNSVLCIM
ncbi:hypothetical protein Droror1_Dr00013453 [Drosera rotundifolia]